MFNKSSAVLAILSVKGALANMLRYLKRINTAEEDGEQTQTDQQGTASNPSTTPESKKQSSGQKE
ncbi:hypothetical protein AAFF_G00019760, partial [Aldrovandia affinis]